MSLRDALSVLYPAEGAARAKEMEAHRLEHAALRQAEAARRAEAAAQASAQLPPAFAPYFAMFQFPIHGPPPAAEAGESPAERAPARRPREEVPAEDARETRRRRRAEVGPLTDAPPGLLSGGGDEGARAAPPSPQANPFVALGMPAAMPPALQAAVSRLLGRAMEAMAERGRAGAAPGAAPGAPVPLPAMAAFPFHVQFQMGDDGAGADQPFPFLFGPPGVQPPRRR